MWSVWMQLRFGANLPLQIYTRMCVWTTCWLMHVHRCAWENSESHTEGCIYRFKERGWRVSEGNKFRDQNRPMEGRLNAAWKRKAGTTWSKVDWARMKGETAPDWKAVRACWLQLARLLEGSVSAENRKIRLCFYYCSRRCPCTTANPPTNPPHDEHYLPVTPSDSTRLYVPRWGDVAAAKNSCSCPFLQCLGAGLLSASLRAPPPSPERGSFMTGDHHVSSYLHHFWLG